jgi:hypothetical protein
MLEFILFAPLTDVIHWRYLPVGAAVSRVGGRLYTVVRLDYVGREAYAMVIDLKHGWRSYQELHKLTRYTPKVSSIKQTITKNGVLYEQ